MFQSIVNATLSLMLFRAGPQDFPFHPPLTGVLVPLTALANYWVLASALPPVMAAAVALAVVIGMAYATRMLLRIRSLPERFMQTYHSLLAVSTVTTLMLWLPFSEVAPEMQRLAQDPDAVSNGVAPQIPGWAAVSMNLINIWSFAINANIFRQAGGLGMGMGLIVAILMTFAVLLLVLVFGVFLGTIFQASPA